jgi:ribose 5-phosphate isomerase B
MKILLASDHAGFELKNHLVSFLKQEGFEVEDCGPFEYNESDNYPELIAPVAQCVSEDGELRAVVLGGSGQGEAIVADKFDNVRATTYYGGPLEIVELGRKHNDANVLSLGARFVTQQEAEQACLLFLTTEFEGGRHEKRIEEIEKIEETN